MKPELTHEQCRVLEKWGLDQTLWFGTLFYYWGTKRFAGMLQQEEEGWVLGVCEYSPKRKTPPTYDYVKLPSAEEMIEWLESICDSSQNRFDIVYYRSSNHTLARFCGVQAGPHIRADVKGKPIIEGINQALYALCEKVFGGRRRDEDIGT